MLMAGLSLSVEMGGDASPAKHIGLFLAGLFLRKQQCNLALKTAFLVHLGVGTLRHRQSTGNLYFVIFGS